MRTTTPLTADDIQLLTALKKPNHWSSYIFLCLLFVVPGLLVLFGLQSSWITWLIGGVLLAIGIILPYLGWRKPKLQILPTDYERHTITDTLLYAQLKGDKMIRYHFRDQVLDLSIPTVDRHDYEYDRKIQDASILVNIPVTLSYTTYKRGILLLLDIKYSQYSHDENIVEIHPEDKRRIFSKSYRALSWIVLICIGLITLIYFLQRQEGIIPILFFMSIIGIIAYSVYKRFLSIRNATHKIVIRTTITEILDIMVDNGSDSTTKKTYYRLGNGALVHIDTKGFKVEDKVLIQFLVHEDDSRGELIEMVKI